MRYGSWLVAAILSVLLTIGFTKSTPVYARGGGAANLMNSPGYQRAQKESRERYLARYYGSQAQSVHRRKKARHR